MRITQGTFSFLPDLTDERDRGAAALRPAQRLGDHGRAHRRPASAQLALGDVGPAAVRAGRGRGRDRPARGARRPRGLPARVRQGRRLRPLAGPPDDRPGFIVGRPAFEPGFRLERQEKADRQIRYTLHPYATDVPAGMRYRATGTATGNGALRPVNAQLQPVTPAPTSDIEGVLAQLDRDLVALEPVKTRIREIAALLVIDRHAPRAGPDLVAPVAAHVLHRQPRHGQDDRRAADGRDPAPARLHREADGRLGHARRPRRPVRGPHRPQDQGGAQARPRRGPLHRRGLLPVPARERARLRRRRRSRSCCR